VAAQPPSGATIVLLGSTPPDSCSKVFLKGLGNFFGLEEVSQGPLNLSILSFAHGRVSLTLMLCS
jgi:hypothetical protein